MKLIRKSNILPLSTLVLSGALAIACGGGSDGTSGGGDGDGDSALSGDGDGDEGETGDGDMSGDEGDGDMTGDGDADSEAMGGSAGNDLETAAPGVLNSNIEDGDTGVLPDASIVITFSEPMDRKSVEEAYSSETLPAEDMEFSWNDDWTVLTVRPLDGLKFETSESADELDPAVSYDFLIDKTALSAGGENIGHSLNVSFSTARQISAIVPASGSFTGSVRSDGGSYSIVYTGDAAVDDLFGNAGYYGTMTFNVMDIDNAIAVGGAQIVFSRTVYNFSNPEELGEPSLFSVEADERTWDAVHPQIVESNLVGPVEHHSGNEYFVDVSDALMADLSGDGLAQFALAQPEKSSPNDTADAYRYQNLILTFSYWVN